jgi:hypothetical protein
MPGALFAGRISAVSVGMVRRGYFRFEAPRCAAPKVVSSSYKVVRLTLFRLIILSVLLTSSSSNLLTIKELGSMVIINLIHSTSSWNTDQGAGDATTF